MHKPLVFLSGVLLLASSVNSYVYYEFKDSQNTKENVNFNLISLHEGFLVSVAERLLINILQNSEKNVLTLPRAPLIPDLEDPLNITDGENSFDSDLIRGTLLNWDTEIVGLSTIKDNLTPIVLPPLGITYNFAIEQFDFHGGYEADLKLFNDDLSFTGNGNFSVQLDNTKLDLKLRIKVRPTVIIETFELGLGCDRLALNAENSQINGEQLDWEDISTQITEILEIYYPVLQDTFIPAIKRILNQLIEGCTLEQLLPGENQDLTCIGFKLPTTTTRDPSAPTDPSVPTDQTTPTTVDTGSGPTDPPNSTSGSFSFLLQTPVVGIALIIALVKLVVL